MLNEEQGFRIPRPRPPHLFSGPALCAGHLSSRVNIYYTEEGRRQLLERGWAWSHSLLVTARDAKEPKYPPRHRLATLARQSVLSDPSLSSVKCRVFQPIKDVRDLKHLEQCQAQQM